MPQHFSLLQEPEPSVSGIGVGSYSPDTFVYNGETFSEGPRAVRVGVGLKLTGKGALSLWPERVRGH